MEAICQQIVNAYEDAHLSLEDINVEFPEMDIVGIKAVLIQYSSSYRQALKDNAKQGVEGLEKDFTDIDLQFVTKGMIQLAQETFDENLKFRCFKYVRDDAKGRKDGNKAKFNINTNIIVFNEHLRKARLMATIDSTSRSPGPSPQSEEDEVSATIEV